MKSLHMESEGNLFGWGNQYRYFITNLKCDLYPRLKVKLSGDGEFTPHAPARSSNKVNDLPQIVSADGRLVYPMNLYLTVCARKTQNINTSAKALLMYCRWLDFNNRSYKDVYAEPEDGSPHLFGRFLIRCIKNRNKDPDKPTLALSTAKTYMRIIIDFYKWMHKEGVFIWTDNVKPFIFSYKRIFRNSKKHVDMLSHTRRNQEIVVQTTHLMKEFPRNAEVEEFKKLKPLTRDSLDILEGYIQSVEFPVRDRLVIELAYYGGLRIEEVATLNEGAIYQPKLDDDECNLVINTLDGVETKGDKSRVTKIPASLMRRLFDYKISEQRQKIVEKLKASGVGADFEPKLILSPRTLLGQITTNTIESIWSKLRKKIQIKFNDWYYKFHDLRATFATHYLLSKSEDSSLPLSHYISGLQVLMGHSESTDTLKYVDFLNDLALSKRAAYRRNREAQGVVNA